MVTPGVDEMFPDINMGLQGNQKLAFLNEKDKDVQEAFKGYYMNGKSKINFKFIKNLYF